MTALKLYMQLNDMFNFPAKNVFVHYEIVYVHGKYFLLHKVTAKLKKFICLYEGKIMYRNCLF